MARVMLDLDGVVYDFGAALRRYLCDQLGRDEEEFPEPTRWEFYLDWGFDLRGFKRLVQQGVDEAIIFRQGDPHFGSQEMIDKLLWRNHSIHVVTHRGDFGAGAVANTHAWLDAQGLYYDSLTFAADKTVVKVDYAIEDNADNCRALLESGVSCYLLDRPWNEHANDLPRVFSLAEFVDKVQ